VNIVKELFNEHLPFFSAQWKQAYEN